MSKLKLGDLVNVGDSTSFLILRKDDFYFTYLIVCMDRKSFLHKYSKLIIEQSCISVTNIFRGVKG